MSPDNPHNRDLSARLADLIAANNIDAIMEQQPVRWRPATLRVHFQVDVANLVELDPGSARSRLRLSRRVEITGPRVKKDCWISVLHGELLIRVP